MKQRQKLPIVDMSIAELMMILIMLSLLFFLLQQEDAAPQFTEIPAIPSSEGLGIQIAANCAIKLDSENINIEAFSAKISYEENKFHITEKYFECTQNLCRQISEFLDEDLKNRSVDIVGYASTKPFKVKTSGFYARHGCKYIGESKGCNELISWLRAKTFIEACYATSSRPEYSLYRFDENQQPLKNFKGIWNSTDNFNYRQKISLNAFGNWQLRLAGNLPDKRIDIYFKNRK